jgi:hypothetical protein
VPGSDTAPRVRLYGEPSFTLAAPLIAIDGATLSTCTDCALARLVKVPSSSTRSTVMSWLLGPSAYVCVLTPFELYGSLEPSPQWTT